MEKGMTVTHYFLASGAILAAVRYSTLLVKYGAL